MIYATALLTLASAAGVAGAQPRPWSSAQLTPQERAARLLSQMTIEEKVVMLHGKESSEYSGVVEGNERLGIPTMNLSDGPQGMRDNNNPGTTTAFPSGLAVAATWDLSLCRQWGEAMGEEFYNKGVQIQLGPGMNIARVPVNGRNFEYMSGGDSFLGFKIVQPVIKGIQSKGVIANAKHWVENNQETNRDDISEFVDERTRHEFYYRPFAGAVNANVGSFMCSYNKVNGFWSCENPETLHDLKEHLGFSGWVMSDWGATHSLSIEQGLDREMPGQNYFGQTLLDAVADGSISVHTIDEAVRRILVPMFDIGLFDNENTNQLSNNVRTAEHTALTRALSGASHVLLKNDNSTLPLPLKGPLRIALFGGGVRAPIVAGGGSGAVFPANVVTPFEAILETLGIIDKNPTIVTCDPSTYMNDVSYDQSGCQSAPSTSVEDCANQCTEYELCSFFTFSGSRCEFYPTGYKKIPSPGVVSGQCMRKYALPTSTWQCNKDDICVASLDGSDLEAVSDLAAESDIAIAILGTFAKEGSDRESLSFAQFEGNMCSVAPINQDEMIPVIAAKTTTVVAMTGPAAVLTPWRNEVHSILYGFFPGEEYGHSLMDIIFGAVNPSGRLPLTLPNIENEVGFTRAQYPGIALEGFYTEGMYVDYRWYTAHDVSPAFSFGHGLSYTTFEYSDFEVQTPNQFSVMVRNSGLYAGAEVAQLYISYPKDANTPPIQLRGFQKTAVLQPGDSEHVTFYVDDVDLSIWKPKKISLGGWEKVHGTFTAFAGASSSDLRLQKTFDV